MKKSRLIPRLAVMGIRKNGSTYLPYIGVSIFAVFTYFVFDLILNNDVVKTVPKAEYALLLLSMGFGLLAFIMIPFLYYTNSFLIKRRQKEMGLYSILGLEKKHIGMMMLCETAILYVVVVIGAVLLGLLFSKLVFLLLLNLADLPVEATFTISPRAIKDTLVFYAIVSLINLSANLFQVGRVSPVELMSESKRGEKEPKHIFIWTVLGLVCMGCGYYLAIASAVDSMIFVNFFLAVLMVAAGTHFLFTSGSISLLRGFKGNKKFYYKPDNFITVSGMLYRMKKNAASLVNICIFATMVLITVICTVVVYLGIPRIQEFTYPFDMEVNFNDASFAQKDAWLDRVREEAGAAGVTIEDLRGYTAARVSVLRDEDRFKINDGGASYGMWYGMNILPLDSFNSFEGASYELEAGEVLLYCTGQDFGYEEITIADRTFRIKEELQEASMASKARNNQMAAEYYVVVKDREALNGMCALFGVDPTEGTAFKAELSLAGERARLDLFAARLEELSSGYEGYASYFNNIENKDNTSSMFGGLLFIGIFYGLIFAVCLLIIMYYKQITEGFEDQKSFEIMQEVGMSDQEVRRTVKKQILLVFFLPLVGAVVHTIVGMNMVIKLLAVLNMYDTFMAAACTAGVCVLFALLYIFCYKRTAGTYYRIVKQMA